MASMQKYETQPLAMRGLRKNRGSLSGAPLVRLLSEGARLENVCLSGSMRRVIDVV